MTEPDWLVEGFEENRIRLPAVAYRMLGSLAEADDAVQETWLRLARSDASSIENLGSWLTAIVARVCLNMLRSRKTRHEELAGLHLPDPVISPNDGTNPQEQALLADSVGLALQVALGTLTPAERLAFVLHDMFGPPFAQIAPLAECSPASDGPRRHGSRPAIAALGPARMVPGAGAGRRSWRGCCGWRGAWALVLGGAVSAA